MTFTEINSTNFDTLQHMLQYPSHVVTAFYPLVFFGLWLILVLASYFGDRERDQKGDLLGSMAVMGLVIIIIAGISTLFNLINTTTMIIIFIIGALLGVLKIVNNRSN